MTMKQPTSSLLLAVLLLISFPSSIAKVLDFLDDFSSIPFDKSYDACKHNAELLAKVLSQNASNNVLRFPVNTTFHFHHGVKASNLRNSVIQLDGVIRFEKSDLPREKCKECGTVACITIDRSKNVTITSQYRGLIDGRGSQYWGIPLIGYVQIEESRPRLLRFNLAEDLLIENIILQDSPYHTLYLDAVNRVEIRNISIVARRTSHDGHSWLDLTAFNTDGIDVSGSNVWVHDCDIWVQDDCIAVKDVKKHKGVPFDPVSSNMTFERINATGFGLTIGSIIGTHVKNITFRDSYLHKTLKGIYMKFANKKSYYAEQNLSGVVEDVLYDNITMEAPMQWPVWIGPAQQSDSSDLCHPNPCSLCWPMTPGSKCHVVPVNKFRNITLRNIRINNPQMAPGVIYGSKSATIDDLAFENVLVTQGTPLAISKLDIHETFPGTNQPIHDKHVPHVVAGIQHEMDGLLDHVRAAVLRARDALEKSRGTYSTAAVTLVQNGGGADGWYLSVILQSVLGSVWMWLLLALFMGILSICVLRHWTRFTHSDEAPNRRWLYHSLYAVLFLVFMFSCVCFSIFPFRKPKWQRTNQYYECKGVKNGVARGSTSPIPPCFEYDSQWVSDSPFEEDLSSADASVVDVTILFLCLLLVMVMVVEPKRNNGFSRVPSEDPDDDGPTEPSEDEV